MWVGHASPSFVTAANPWVSGELPRVRIKALQQGVTLDCRSSMQPATSEFGSHGVDVIVLHLIILSTLHLISMLKFNRKS